MEIRRATKDDATAIAQTHVESWEATYTEIFFGRGAGTALSRVFNAPALRYRRSL